MFTWKPLLTVLKGRFIDHELLMKYSLLFSVVKTQLHFICLTGNFRKGVVRLNWVAKWVAAWKRLKTTGLKCVVSYKLWNSKASAISRRMTTWMSCGWCLGAQSSWSEKICFFTLQTWILLFCCYTAPTWNYEMGVSAQQPVPLPLNLSYKQLWLATANGAELCWAV